ncbi:MAG TPA: glycosyltransferase family 39 protein, partial [Polyangiaceae bacterium]|nr:glycosyltransferase family 39 protein [Polyangiaceae bacterium]
LGPSEAVLRALPWCAGVATTLMAPALARRLFQSSGARLLFVSIIALHPGAIDLSKEFKQYSVALAFHSALLLLALRYLDSGRTRDLAAVLVAASCAVFFAQDAVFAYPGLFVVLAISAGRSRHFRHMAAIGGATLLTLGIVACMYLFIWSKMGEKEDGEKFWGKKYDVFYVPAKAHEDRTEWTAGHYAEIAALPGSRRSLWARPGSSANRVKELRSLDAIVWLLLHVAGLVVIIRTRRVHDALLLMAPLFVLTLFNVLGYWPLGEFRTNLFALVYVAAIASVGIDHAAKRVRWVDLLPAGALVLVPLFAFERTWHSRKATYTTSADFPHVMRELLFLQGAGYAGPPETLIADNSSCQPWQYYMKYHPTTARTLGPSLRRRFELSCVPRRQRMLGVARQELTKASRVWLLASKETVTKPLEQSWPDDLERDVHVWIGHKDHLLIAATRKPAVAPLPEPDTDEDRDLGP